MVIRNGTVSGTHRVNVLYCFQKPLIYVYETQCSYLVVALPDVGYAICGRTG